MHSKTQENTRSESQQEMALYEKLTSLSVIHFENSMAVLEGGMIWYIEITWSIIATEFGCSDQVISMYKIIRSYMLYEVIGNLLANFCARNASNVTKNVLYLYTSFTFLKRY